MNKYKNKNRYVHIFNNMNYNNTFNISSKWHRNLFFLLKKKKPQTLKGQKQKNDKLLYKKSAIQHLNINNNNSIFGCKSRSFLQCLNQDEGGKKYKNILKLNLTSSYIEIQCIDVALLVTQMSSSSLVWTGSCVALLEMALESANKEGRWTEGSKCTLNTGMLGWAGSIGGQGDSK